MSMVNLTATLVVDNSGLTQTGSTTSQFDLAADARVSGTQLVNTTPTVLGESTGSLGGVVGWSTLGCLWIKNVGASDVILYRGSTDVATLKVGEASVFVPRADNTNYLKVATAAGTSQVEYIATDARA